MTTELIIIGNQKKNILPPKIQQIFKFPSLITLFTSPVWVPVLYSIGYLFLYGFYFSPLYIDDPDVSTVYFTPLFDVIRHPVPFNFYTVILSTVFFLILTIWMYVIYLVLSKNKEQFPFLLLLPVILYFLLQATFSGTLEFSLDGLLFVLIFLAIPVMLLSFALILNKLVQNIYSTFAAVLWGLLIASFLISIVKQDAYTYVMLSFIVLVAVLIIFFNFVFNKSKKIKFVRHVYKIIVILPIALISCGLIIWILDETLLHLENKFIVIIILATLTSIYIAWRPFLNNSLFMENTPLLDELTNTPMFHSFKETLENAYKLFKRNRELFFVFLGITTFIVFTFLAIIATVIINIGSITYDNLPKHGQFLQQQDTISILSIDSSGAKTVTKTYTGKVVALKEGILYISDQNRNLVIIKSDDFLIEPTMVKTKK